MADVKWIKITTSIFEDEKFDAIETLADKNMIQLAWIKLLCLAGRCNDNGFLTLSNEIPYTDEMIANRFNMSIGDVQRALLLFQHLGMIEVVNDAYMVSNWLKYQNGDNLDLIREKNRERQQRFRDKQKALKLEQKEDRNVTNNVTNNVNCSLSISPSLSNLSFSKDIDTIKDIIDYLNTKANKSFNYKTKKSQEHISARLKEGYTIEDFKKVIDNKVAVWLNNPEMNEYLRPSTLFAPGHFDEYLNQTPKAIMTDEEKIQASNDEWEEA